MPTAYLHLGSNIGDRKIQLDRAVALLEDQGVEVVQKSHYYETEPWGEHDQEDFINLALHVRSQLSPEQLINVTQQIEKDLGKDKQSRFGARTIDIDILLCEDKVIDSKSLVIPHPRMHLRNFVLIPMLEIAAEVIHPTSGLTMEELYLQCQDSGEVIQLEY